MEARHQCPFVNRPDSRCSQRLNIDRLGHAFEFCFNSYSTCPVYLERLVERRVRREREGGTRDGTIVRHDTVYDYGSSYVQLRTPTAARPARAS